MNVSGPFVPPPQAPVEPPQHHACFGGYAACSGCSPCPQCWQQICEKVLAPAVMAAQLNGQAAIDVQNMVQALRQRGVDPLTHLGASAAILGLQPQDQVGAFWAGAEYAMKELHAGMLRTPGRFRVRDLRTGEIVQDIVAAPARPAPVFVPPPQHAPYVPAQQAPYVAPPPPPMQPSLPFQQAPAPVVYPNPNAGFITSGAFAQPPQQSFVSHGGYPNAAAAPVYPVELGVVGGGVIGEAGAPPAYHPPVGPDAGAPPFATSPGAPGPVARARTAAVPPITAEEIATAGMPVQTIPAKEKSSPDLTAANGVASSSPQG